MPTNIPPEVMLIRSRDACDINIGEFMVYSVDEWQNLVLSKPHGWFNWDRDYWGVLDNLDWHESLVSNVLCKGSPLNTPDWASCVIHLPSPLPVQPTNQG